MNTEARRCESISHCLFYLCLFVFVGGSIFGAAGCQTQGVETQTYAGKPANQRYELEEVERRLDEIEPGMGKIQVLLTLGSPAIQEPDHWIYLPSRTGTIIPAKALRVDFRGQIYTGWKKQPIILGERFTD